MSEGLDRKSAAKDLGPTDNSRASSGALDTSADVSERPFGDLYLVPPSPRPFGALGLLCRYLRILIQKGKTRSVCSITVTCIPVF